MKLLVSAGEVSGDQRAGEVVGEVKKLVPSLSIKCMGGDVLESLGAELIVDSRKVGGVMGFVDVVKKLSDITESIRLLEKQLVKWRPDAVLLIDFPDFNFKIARSAKKLGIPVFYYIPPKVWAWRSYRAKKLGNLCSQIFTIFPFEKPFFASKDVSNVEYVGHPFTTNLKSSPTSEERSKLKEELCSELGLDQNALLLLMPGSRDAEIQRHIKVLSEVLKKFTNQQGNAILALPSEETARNCWSQIPEETRESFNDRVKLVVGDSERCMRAADFGLLKSGTCNLEAAFAGLPFAVFYKASKLSELIVKQLVKLSEVSIVNIVRSGTVKEYLQEDFNVKNLWDIILELNNASYTKKLEEKLRLVTNDLDPSKGAVKSISSSGLVARKIISHISRAQ